MTVPAQPTHVHYNGSGSNGPFTFPMVFGVNSEIVVTKTSVAGVSTVLTENTHYTLTGALSAYGGSVTLVTALATGETLLISRVLDLTQPYSFRNQGAFYPEMHERAYDRVVMEIQQVDQDLTDYQVSNDAALQAVVTDYSAADTVIRANLATEVLNRSAGDDLVRSEIYGLGKAVSVVDLGLVDNLEAAVAAFGAAQGTITIGTSQTLTGNLTLHADLVLRIYKPTLITIPTGATLTINSPFNPGAFHIFICQGTGKVVFGLGAVSEVLPEWWGAKATGDVNDAATNTVAIDAAIVACQTGATALNSPVPALKFQHGTYHHSGITIPSSHTICNITGSGRTATYLSLPAAATVPNINIVGPVSPDAVPLNGRFTLRDISLQGNASGEIATQHGVMMNGGYEFLFDNVGVHQHGGHGIYLAANSITAGTYGGEVMNCEVNSNKMDGIHAVATGASDDQKNGIFIRDCNIQGNVYNGISAWGVEIVIANNQLQSNYRAGVYVPYSDTTPSYSSGPIHIIENYFENNRGGSVRAVTTAGKSIHTLTMVRNSFSNVVPMTYDWGSGVPDSAVTIVSSGSSQVVNLEMMYNRYVFNGQPADVAAAYYADLGGYVTQGIVVPSITSYPKAYDNELYTKYKNYGEVKIVCRSARVLNGLKYAMGASGVTYAGLVKSNTVATGSYVYFPLDLHVGAIFSRFEVPVETDATEWRVTFSIVSKDAAGTSAHSTTHNSYYPSVSTWHSGSVLATSTDYVGNYIDTCRIKYTNADVLLKITVTINTAGTYFYLGNPVMYFN